MSKITFENSNLEHGKVAAIIGEIDPDVIQCEQCRRYKNKIEVTMHESPTGKVHAYCNDCFLPSCDE